MSTGTTEATGDEKAAKKGNRDVDKVLAWFEEARKDRGDVARLRRCSTPDEAACEEVTFSLARTLRDEKDRVSENDLRRAGFIAGILSEVRDDAPGRTFGAMLGEPRGGHGGPPRFSRLRFRALADAREPQEAMAAFRRAVGILDRKVPLASLVERLLDWTNQQPHPFDPSGRRTRADQARLGLTKEYHEAIQD